MPTFPEDELKWLDDTGLRLTGSDTHNQLIDRVQHQLQNIGLKVEIGATAQFNLTASIVEQKRAVFGLGLEHLGAREFSSRTSGTSAPVSTGRNEPELLYATTKETAQFCKQHWKTSYPGRGRISRPSALIHFGEAEPLMQKGISSVALVTLPIYLLSLRIYLLSLRQDGYVAQKLMARQMDDFACTLKHADSTPSDGFGKVGVPSILQKGREAASAVYSHMFTSPKMGS